MDYKNDKGQRMLVSHRATNSMETFSITLPRKCERLATAMYLVTNFLSDNEPIKARLRGLSVDFVRDASLLKNGNCGVESNVLDLLRANILESLALLELAFVAGLISEMNFTILKREYAALRDSIDVKKASRESRTDSVLGDTFFGTSLREEEDDKKLSDVSRAPLTSRPHSYQSVPQNLASKMSDRGQVVDFVKDKKETTPRAATSVLKEGRRARILKLIKDNREVAIKDIVEHFADVSDKTIQRELGVLVDSGVLKKTGERRWSKYRLA